MAEVSHRGSAFPAKQARRERRPKAGRRGERQAEDEGRPGLPLRSVRLTRFHKDGGRVAEKRFKLGEIKR